MEPVYKVVCGNIGTVAVTLRYDRAVRVYRDYCNLSRLPYGLPSGEPVALLANGEPVKEYFPSEQDNPVG